MIQREPIYSAIFAKLNAVKGFRTVTRRFKLWNEYQPEAMPVCSMIQAGEEADQRGGCPTVWTLSIDILLYCYQADETESPMPQLNALVDQIEALFAPDDPVSGRLTLDGLVSHCWLEGGVEVFEGAIASHSIAVIPVRVLVA